VKQSRPVGSSDDEDILLAAHAIHLSQQLVDDPVCGTTAVADTATTRLSNRVQLVKEQHTWSRSTSLSTSTDVNMYIAKLHTYCCVQLCPIHTLNDFKKQYCQYS